MADYEHLAERLDQIAEELDDIAFDRLREAVADGEVERPRERQDVDAGPSLHCESGAPAAVDQGLNEAVVPPNSE